jgi:lysozyme C
VATSKLLGLFAAGSLAALASFAAIGCAAPTEDDAEALGETEDHLLSGTRYTPSQVATYLRQAGFAENTIGKMVCTAKYESSYYARATNKNKNGSTDRGLFQIDSLHIGKTKGCPSSAEGLFNPQANAKCAMAVFKSQGINAWYGYKKHKSECDRTKAPGSAAVPAADDDTDTTTTKPTDTSGTKVSTGSGADTDATDSTPATGTTTTPTTTDPNATIDPDADYDLGAGCWSATKQDTMPPLSCVQQTSSNIWFQCKEGKWYRGGDDVQGIYGYCNGSYPLAQ